MTKHFCDFCGQQVFHKGTVSEDGRDIVDKDSRYLLREAGWLYTAHRSQDKYPSVILCSGCYEAGMKPVNEFVDRIERIVKKT